MAKKKKYYVVWKGHEPGIYESWTDCQLQTKGYPGAQYKAFPTREAAREALDTGPAPRRPNALRSSPNKKSIPEDIHPLALSVDAACSGNPGRMEYRGVWVHSGEEWFKKGPYNRGTNNIGEFLALVHAGALLLQENRTDLPIYTDSRTAMAWVRKKKANTKMKFTARNQKLKEMIQRAERWLHNNEIANPILKWETKAWGEIPADFGRK
jgi:ribonuclease HI